MKIQSALAWPLALFVATAAATEGGGSSYPVGVETNFSGAMLPEGANFLLYYQHYAADRVRDNSGGDNARFAYFRTQADVLALRLSYVWPGLRLAGAKVETRVVLPIPALDVTLGIARPAPLGTLDRSGTASGIGDATLAPVLLGWHGPTVHQMAGFELIVPTGAYSVAESVNPGRNTWQAAALYGVSWLPAGWEASARLRYGVNGRNAETDYRSGDEFTVEFSGGRKLGAGWSAGINGYFYRQLSDDEQRGARVNGDGNRGSANAFGPYVAWSLSRQASLIVKFQQESAVRNRAEGQRLWVQARYSF